jgi:glycosyltransferase involved in cell wall biosynthesis
MTGKGISSTRSLLYVLEATSGGIAEYGLHQAAALNESGVKVHLLTRKGFQPENRAGVSAEALLPERPAAGSRILKVFSYIRDSRQIGHEVARVCAERNIRTVLLDCFREYLAPFWAGPFQRLAASGITIGVVAHDPQRDFVVGPQWWHDRSIRSAYAFIRDVYVHERGRIDWGGSQPERIRVHTIPHGPFAYPEPEKGREKYREELGIQLNETVLLSFGQIRDGKNLDQILRALVHLPDSVKLIVAGRGDSQSQLSPDYYKSLATELGVEGQCIWKTDYIPDAAVSDLFASSDIVLLTYSEKFVSASGVFNTAMMLHRPVVASAGEGPLKRALKDYPIGVWLDDPVGGLIAGAVSSIMERAEPFAFTKYLNDHSWEENARVVRETLFAD